MERGLHLWQASYWNGTRTRMVKFWMRASLQRQSELLTQVRILGRLTNISLTSSTLAGADTVRHYNAFRYSLAFTNLS